LTGTQQKSKKLSAKLEKAKKSSQLGEKMRYRFAEELPPAREPIYPKEATTKEGREKTRKATTSTGPMSEVEMRINRPTSPNQRTS